MKYMEIYHQPKHILSEMPLLFCLLLKQIISKLPTFGKSGKSYGSEAFPQDSVPDPDPPDPCVFVLPDPDPLVRNMDPDPSIIKPIEQEKPSLISTVL